MLGDDVGDGVGDWAGHGGKGEAEEDEDGVGLHVDGVDGVFLVGLGDLVFGSVLGELIRFDDRMSNLI